jgi:NAD(P)-dependent dehydrogenase (short-subunit alcohol dehydrogenase family)
VAEDVLVVIGVGGMGEAIARRSGPGHTILLADIGEEALEAAASGLREDGLEVATHSVDVADASSVADLAEAAGSLGSVRSLAHTAGLSPVQASSDRIVDVDLLGVAHALESFGEVVAPGGAGVVISSNSGYLVGPLPPADEAAISGAGANGLATLGCVDELRQTDPGLAYAGSKRIVRLLVRLASLRWGEKQARVNSISPGIISTPMGEAELAGPHGEGMRHMLAGSAAGRAGRPEEIAAAAAFLLGPDASYVTGTDLLVDGGMIAALLTPPPAG